MPWSWDLIDAGFNSMVDALPNIVENPKTTLSNLEGGVVRYTKIYIILDYNCRLLPRLHP